MANIDTELWQLVCQYKTHFDGSHIHLTFLAICEKTDIYFPKWDRIVTQSLKLG